MVQPKSLLYLIALPLAQGFVVPISNSTEAVVSVVDATSAVVTVTDVPTSSADDFPSTTSDITPPTDATSTTADAPTDAVTVISPAPTDIPDSSDSGEDSATLLPDLTPTPVYDPVPIETDDGSASTVTPTPDFGSGDGSSYGSPDGGSGSGYGGYGGPSTLEELSFYADQALDSLLILIEFARSAIYGAPYQMDAATKEKVEKVKSMMGKMKMNATRAGSAGRPP